MTDLHELLVNRHSIRRYTDEHLAPEDVKLILEAALLAPTSKSSRPWQFIVVEDKDMLQRLSECKESGAGPVSRAALAVVVAVDPSLSDPWIEDASIAATLMQLQAADLGLGSCWIQVRDRYRADGVSANEYVQELLGIPETLPVVCIVTFGHKAEERKPVDTSKLLWEKVHIGQWKEV
ncbi:MAG: nitroreductase family protein [Pseudoflavonifractor sp.]|nr:nitroreductase family protein [Pseudoflavonifractor sp.]